MTGEEALSPLLMVLISPEIENRSQFLWVLQEKDSQVVKLEDHSPEMDGEYQVPYGGVGL